MPGYAYRILADLVVVIHLLFVFFVVIGGVLVLRWKRAAFAHLPAALWGAWIEFSGGICPLTPLENRLRRLAGQAGYETGFIEHYLLPILYPNLLTEGVQYLLGGLVVAMNVVVYLAVFHRLTEKREK